MTTRTPIAAPPCCVAAALALLSAAPAARAGTPINQRAAADPAGQVEVSNTVGSIVVTGWDRSEVEVTGELGDGVERLEFSRDKQLTRVKVILPSRSARAEDTELLVKVPAGSGLAVNAVSGDVIVKGVRGSQRLQSVSGDVETEVSAEDVECKTVSGDVRVTGSGQRSLLTVTSVSGDVTLTRVAGEVNGNTVSGNLSVGMGETSRSRLRSTSGDVRVRSRLAGDARVDFESTSGDVRLDLDGPVNAEFDLSSFNGDINNCFGPKAVRTSEYTPGIELRFREGSGGARVRIKAFNGDINLCNK
jgi:DUF4097 and DUF4098 domain-containing protein YvlB